MLKINKDTFELNFFHKTSIYQKQFLIAFSIAFFFHLLFFVLFKITSCHEADSNTHFKISLPLQKFVVEQKGNVCFEIEKLYENNMAALNPPSTVIQFPKIVPALLDSFSDYFIANQKELDLSSLELEQQILLKNDPLPLTISYPQFSISAYGPLSHKIKETPEPKILKLEASKIKTQKALFDVIVDNLSGKIIWFQAKENKLLSKKFNHLLQKTLFLLDKNEFITKGQIEILYHD